MRDRQIEREREREKESSVVTDDFNKLANGITYIH